MVDKSLASYSIKDGIRFIGQLAFKGCTSLTSITIPDTVIDIGDSAFSGCSGHLIINSSVVERDLWSATIRPANWVNLALFSKLTIGNNIKKVGGQQFYNCTSLTSVTIGNSVIEIGECAFGSCKNLTSINIPDSVTAIRDNAFYRCTSLPTTNNIRYADTYLVEAVNKNLTEYTIKDGT